MKGCVLLLLLLFVTIATASIVDVAPESLDAYLQQQQANNQNSVVVEFYDPNCPDCQRFASTYEQLHSMMTQTTFVRVNVGRYLGASAFSVRNRYGIHEVPSLILFSKTAASRFVGHPSDMTLNAVAQWLRGASSASISSSFLQKEEQAPTAAAVVVTKKTVVTTAPVNNRKNKPAVVVEPVQYVPSSSQKQPKTGRRFASPAAVKRERSLAKQLFKKLERLSSEVQQASTLLASESRLTDPADKPKSCNRCHRYLKIAKARVKHLWKILIKNAPSLKKTTTRRIAADLSAMDAQIQQEERTVQAMFAAP